MVKVKSITPRAIFFDRDGVINDLVKHGDEMTAPWTISEFKFKENILPAIDLIKSMGFLTFVVSNQPDLRSNVNDGPLTLAHLDLMTRLVKNWLHVDEIRYAHDRNDKTYKPGTGMIDALYWEYALSLFNCYMIGDSWKDIVAGHNSGLTTFYIGGEYIAPQEYKHISPDYIVDDVLEACLLIQILENKKDGNQVIR